jgi:hypothetical protein
MEYLCCAAVGGTPTACATKKTIAKRLEISLALFGVPTKQGKKEIRVRPQGYYTYFIFVPYEGQETIRKGIVLNKYFLHSIQAKSTFLKTIFAIKKRLR